MITGLVSDFSRVLLTPVDAGYVGGLNALEQELSTRGDYDFWKYFQLNRDLLQYYRRIAMRMPVYLFTSKYIQEHPALRADLDSIFTSIFSAARLGVHKSDMAAYARVAAVIGLPPHELLYIDDDANNCEAAARAGMVVLRYRSNVQIVDDSSRILAEHSV